MLTAALVAVSSCEREQDFLPDGGDEAVTVTVQALAQDIATKTYLGTYDTHDNTVLWGTGEQMLLAVTSGGSSVFATSEATDAYDGQPEATFSFTVAPVSAASYLYQGLYPATVAVSGDNTNPAQYKVSLPQVQNATAACYDPAAYIMIAQPKTFDSKETSWKAYFKRAV